MEIHDEWVPEADWNGWEPALGPQNYKQWSLLNLFMSPILALIRIIYSSPFVWIALAFLCLFARLFMLWSEVQSTSEPRTYQRNHQQEQLQYQRIDLGRGWPSFEIPRNSRLTCKQNPDGSMSFVTTDIHYPTHSGPMDNPRIKPLPPLFPKSHWDYNPTYGDDRIQRQQSLTTLHPSPVARSCFPNQYHRLADVLPPSPYAGFDFRTASSHPKTTMDGNVDSRFSNNGPVSSSSYSYSDTLPHPPQPRHFGNTPSSPYAARQRPTFYGTDQ